MAYVTRFAPSPTGPLHLGHAFSALTAFNRARQHDGTFLLRIEDADRSRCRPAYEEAIFDDLKWLGLSWAAPVLHQSHRTAPYDAALQQLTDLGLTYACACSRADIRAALSAPQEGAGAPIYPGTCRERDLPMDAGTIRLDLQRALATVGLLHFTDSGPEVAGPHRLDPAQMCQSIGDVVLARRDIGTAAYHLSVVVDDAAQRVSDVTRGIDLFDATPLHVLLQSLLRLPTPSYHHHRLIRDDHGKRLAKRDDARALSKYRAEGATPQDIRRLIGL